MYTEQYLHLKDATAISISELKADELENYFLLADREDLLHWLQWNDHNGEYLDHLIDEDEQPLTKEEAIEIMRRQIQG